jgi:hypothetical protein
MFKITFLTIKDSNDILSQSPCRFMHCHMLSENVCLQHRTLGSANGALLQQFGWECLKNVTQNPDLAVSDFKEASW